MNYRNPGKIEFKEKLISTGDGGVYVNFPYNVEEKFGVKGRVPIKVVFEKKIEYRGSLVNMGTRCHIVIVVKDIREKLALSPGDFINVELELDTALRRVILPDDVLTALQKNRKAKEEYEALSYTKQKEYVDWVLEAKKVETRKSRLTIMLCKLDGTA